jgi:hypothetical protein
LSLEQFAALEAVPPMDFGGVVTGKIKAKDELAALSAPPACHAALSSCPALPAESLGQAHAMCSTYAPAQRFLGGLGPAGDRGEGAARRRGALLTMAPELQRFYGGRPQDWARMPLTIAAVLP